MLDFFTAAIAQGALCFFSYDNDTEIFPEGFRDKLFDAEIVAAFGRALINEEPWFRSNIVRVFIAAMAQGTLRFFHGIFTPKSKYSQRDFGIRYLTPRLSLHLYMH